MISINVKIINDNAIFIYPFDDLTFNSLTLYSLKIFICNSYNAKYKTVKSINVMTVYQGLQLTNDDLILKDIIDCTKDDTNKQIEIYAYIMLNNLISSSKNITFNIDEKSIQAAKEYLKLHKHKDELENIPIKRLIEAFNIDSKKYNKLHENNQVPRVPNPDNNIEPVLPAIVPPEVVVPPPVVVWIQYGLILKLVMICVLFTYNRRMNLQRQSIILVVASICYFIQIGAISYWIILLVRYMMGNAVNINIPRPLNQPPNNQNNNQPHNNNIAIVIGIRFITIWEQVLQYSQAGFPILRDPGIFLDVISFFMSFIGSLFPRWAQDNL